MQNSKKRCGKWGPFFVGDPVIYREMRWRIVAEQKGKIPPGCAPIVPEDEEGESFLGLGIVPIDDLDRV